MRKVLIPLDVSSPTSDPQEIKFIMEWLVNNFIREEDHLLLFSVCTTLTSEESLAEQLARHFVYVSNLFINQQPQTVDLDQSGALAKENAQHLLSQFAKLLDKRGVNTEVQVENGNDVLSHMSSVIEQYQPDFIVMYEKRTTPKNLLPKKVHDFCLHNRSHAALLLIPLFLEPEEQQKI